MPSFGSDHGDVLYLIVCAAPPAQHTPAWVEVLQAEDWDVCVIATPAAVTWIDTSTLQRATGHPVRSVFRAPNEPDFKPRGDAVLVAPATFNTINKCAQGVNDNLALGLMNEALGTGSMPIAVVPWVNRPLANHPAYEPNLNRLEAAGVHTVGPAGNDQAAFKVALQSAMTWISTAMA